MTLRRRVLLVSFFYPPNPAVGGRRAAGFAEHLPEFGWDATVLTAGVPRADVSQEGERSRTEVHRVPHRTSRRVRPGSGVRARRTLQEHLSISAPRRLLYRALRHVLPLSPVRMPDATLGWVRRAVLDGRRILDGGEFAAILSSCGPPSSHLIASRLQRISGLPWIADYRDLWSGNHWDRRLAPFEWLERRLERRTLSGASHLTTVSHGMAARLMDLHGKPVDVIYNGFEPERYPKQPPPPPGFRVTYVGSLYWPQQDPTPLLRALAKIRDRKGIDLSECGLELRFIGTPPSVVTPLVAQFELEDLVRVLPPVPHDESLAEQARSTVLLYVGWDDPERDIVAAKLFEYLGANRPILSIGPRGGTVSQILNEARLPDLTRDPDRVVSVLMRWILQFGREGDVLDRPEGRVRCRYTRRAQTGRLARVLDRVALNE